MRAVMVREFGGPEVMNIEELELPKPGAGEALVRIEVAGVNYVDLMRRDGRSSAATVPSIPGQEAAGIVEELGNGVTEVRVGDRVCWTGSNTYATHAVAQAASLVPVPEGIDLGVAAALPMQGIMAHGLVTTSYRVKRGDVVLVQAVTSGIGGLIAQLSKRAGAHVIGTVSTASKVAAAKASGADDVLIRADGDVAKKVFELTGGRGADASFDGIGKDTFDQSIDALRPEGTFVSYGSTSGHPPPLDILRLGARGGLYVTRSKMTRYEVDRTMVLDRMKDLFEGVAAGVIRVPIYATFSLDQVREAHGVLQRAEAVGKVLLLN